MDNSISIKLGTPEHGWLPVYLHYNDYHVNFDASDVLNDPINELYETLANLMDNKAGEITWWLEPGAYIFNIGKQNSIYTLKIYFTYDLHPDEGEIEMKLEKTIIGDYKQIIEPFINCLKQFTLEIYDPKDWPFSFDRLKLNKLFEHT